MDNAENNHILNCGAFMVQRTYEPLGNGVSGFVELGVRMDNGEQVAVKVVSNYTENERMMVRMEYQMAKAVNSPAVIRLLGLVQNKSESFIIMEYCDSSLQDVIKDPNTDQKIISQYFYDIVEAVKSIHKQNVVHRDLKPQNILIKDLEIRITDFGASKVMSDLNTPAQGTVAGSPVYMAPEVLLEEVYSGMCDNFSLGVLLYEMCFKEVPSSSESISEHKLKLKNITRIEIPQDKQISEYLRKVMEGLLEFDPSKRMTLEKAASILESNMLPRTPKAVQRQRSSKANPGLLPSAMFKSRLLRSDSISC